jgi:DNA-binding CsgD family transcriptional regulator/tetratricopeptide (TPR) repeat protein
MARPVRFVGREGELSRLLGALGRDVRLVLVVGDAGVGKTRFVAEGIGRAVAAGMVMVRGECLPLAGTLPLLPVQDALDELARLEGGRLLTAALDAGPGYARDEVARLLPGLGPGVGTAPAAQDVEWRRERLFGGVAELLATVAEQAGPGVGLVVEDVHWADSETLDFLTFVVRAGRRGPVRVVATCRGDEAPLPAHVAGWLARVRADAGTEEIRLGPLSRAEVAGQAAALAGVPVSPQVAGELFARAEGNPFFTEQLVAAALAGQAGGGLRVPAGLPARLAELLAARAGRCAEEARAVLAGLAVAGRSLGEDLLAAVTGLEIEAVRRGLRELAETRLLAENTSGGGHRPRHALLAEAVAAGLLPGERVMLHERTARALAGEKAPAAEVAGHWQAADRPAEELPARIAAAEAAERVCGCAEAAAHWQRAIELSEVQPDAAAAVGIGVPRLSVRAIDALYRAGDSARAGILAEEAYRRFASDPDPSTAAVVCHRAAYFRANDAPATGQPVMEQALRLFEEAPPSSEHAEALLDYARIFLQYGEERLKAGRTALDRALAIAEAAGATALIPRILSVIALAAFVDGQVEEGLASLERGWALARASRDGPALVWLATNESEALLKLGQYQRAADAASRGLDAAQQAGLQSWRFARTLAANAAEALVAVGRTAEAAALIDPLTTTPLDRDRWLVHAARAEIDLLRGDTDAAAERWQLIYAALPALVDRVDFAYELVPRVVEAWLWAGRPGDALRETRRALALFKSPDLTIYAGRLLAAGMRACADLAEQARARRDPSAAADAADAADGLATWVERMGRVPFTDHPTVATISAERATWDAERTRVAGPGDPGAWDGAAKAWQDLSCPHRAGYAWWRQAEAQLDAGQPAAAAAGALRAAAAAADGHAPLLAQIRALAERARIPLQPAAAGEPEAPPPAQGLTRYGLTDRELTVLRLLAAGRTNPQIGAELYISASTASVHVSNILRKLGVSSRVQAAAIAERAGLLAPRPP